MKFLKQLGLGVLDLLLPVRCLFCQKIVDTSRWNLPICRQDYVELPRLEAPACQICGLPLEREFFYLSYDTSADPAPACGACRQRENFISFTLAPFAFQGRMRKLIHAWKFGLNSNWGSFLGSLLVDSLPAKLPGGRWDYLVPIPLSGARREERGFNQARQLAAELARKYEIPVRMFLSKEKRTPAQALLVREERLKNPLGSFSCLNRRKIKNKSLLIVDDIYTTGATVREAARALQKAGARRTAVIVLARSLPPPAGFARDADAENWRDSF